MTALAIAALIFSGIHLFVSGTGLRKTLVRIMGEGSYLTAFSAISLGGLIALGMTYNRAVGSPENVVYWATPVGLMHAGGLVMLLVFLLGVIGLTTPSPTMVQVGRTPDVLGDPTGLHRITRHPFLWAVILWAAFHISVNGDLASIIFFGTFLVVALMGSRSIDAKRDEKLGPIWAGYAQKSSNIPFVAILQGRNKFALSEIAWWQWMAAIGAFATVFYAHLWLFKVAPTPNWSLY
jgi:uncharacterized membrane protein